MKPLRKGLPPQGPALRPLDLSPAISAVKNRYTRIDLDHKLHGDFITNPMVDQGAEVSSLAIADFDDRGRKIEQYPFKPFSITLACIAADGLQKGIPGEANLAAGSVDPGQMQAVAGGSYLLC